MPQGCPHRVAGYETPLPFVLGHEGAGTAALVGAARQGTQVVIDMATLLNGRVVRGVIQGDAVPQLFIPKLIERFYDFEDIERAFEDSKQGRTIKPVLRIGQV